MWRQRTTASTACQTSCSDSPRSRAMSVKAGRTSSSGCGCRSCASSYGCRTYQWTRLYLWVSVWGNMNGIETEGNGDGAVDCFPVGMLAKNVWKNTKEKANIPNPINPLQLPLQQTLCRQTLHAICVQHMEQHELFTAHVPVCVSV